MTLKIWNDVSTSLDLNGPILSIVTDTFAHSVGDTGTARTSVCASEPVPGSGTRTIAFTGVATATFPAGSPSDNDGTLTHQWYKITTAGTEVKLGPSTTYNGETSSTLNLTHLVSPDQNGEQYFVEFGYDPSGYGAVGAAKSVPVCIFVKPRMGCFLLPKLDDNLAPFIGVFIKVFFILCPRSSK